MQKEKFLELLEHSEGRIIDFKQEMYDLNNDDKEYTKLSKLVKDVISFTNTKRTEPSYIVVGAKKNDADNSVELLGLNNNINESILQQKVKDKIFPIPHFNYFTLNYNELTFGVFEFPIHKYERPLSATIKMKGLEVGQYYYRKGSSNAEAIGSIGIDINDWLKSLPSSIEERSFSSAIASLLGKACNIDNKLSTLIAEALSIANNYQLKELNEFCIDQITGIAGKTDEEFKYRVCKVAFCAGKVDEIHPSATSNQVINELKKTKNYWEYGMLIADSISSLEDLMKRTANGNGFVRIYSSTKSMKLECDAMDITFFVVNENYLKIYNNIRQKFISILNGLLAV